MDSQVKFFEQNVVQFNQVNHKGNIMNVAFVEGQVAQEAKEKGLMSTVKSASKRGLSTVDEAFRIVETGAKDIRLSLELIEVQLQVAKGSALIEGVKEFMSLGISQEDANSLMKKLRAD